VPLRKIEKCLPPLLKLRRGMRRRSAWQFPQGGVWVRAPPPAPSQDLSFHAINAATHDLSWRFMLVWSRESHNVHSWTGRTATRGQPNRVSLWLPAGASFFRPRTWGPKSKKLATRWLSFAGLIGGPFSHLCARAAIQSRTRKTSRKIFLWPFWKTIGYNTPIVIAADSVRSC